MPAFLDVKMAFDTQLKNNGFSKLAESKNGGNNES
jgi:hypothetical protein